MCPKPDMQNPQELQRSKEPVFNDATMEQRSKRGRRGTLLTPSTKTDTSTTPGLRGKTLLGQ